LFVKEIISGEAVYHNRCFGLRVDSYVMPGSTADVSAYRSVKFNFLSLIPSLWCLLRFIAGFPERFFLLLAHRLCHSGQPCLYSLPLYFSRLPHCSPVRISTFGRKNWID